MVGSLIFALSALGVAIALEAFIFWAVRERHRDSDLNGLWAMLIHFGRVRTWHIPKHAYPRIKAIRKEVMFADFRDQHLIHGIAVIAGFFGSMALLATLFPNAG